MLGDGPQQIPDGCCLNGGGEQAELVEQALGIPQAALGPLGHQIEGFGGYSDAFLSGDPAQVALKVCEGNAAEVKALAAAQDGGQHPLGVGGGQHKHHPRWRFFQGFEQGIEGRRREHVALVDHVDLPAGLHRRKAGALDQLADVVDAGVGGGVNFDDIEGIAGSDGHTHLAMAAGFRGRGVAADAVERAGQDAGAGGLASAAGSAEEIGGSDAAGAQGIGQGGGDGLLPHQLSEPLGAVFVVEGLVGHGSWSHRRGWLCCVPTLAAAQQALPA